MKEMYIVKSDCTVKDAIEQMEKKLIKAVIVLDENEKIIGLFSNGDMRSHFLKGGELSDSIVKAMNKNPRLYLSEREILEERKKIKRVIYPIADKDKKLLNVIDYDKDNENEININNDLKDVPLVIMAGGKGTRLYPYTKVLPKPLIPIGDMTITERIINEFQKYGCKEVYMILNHKASMIKAYINEIEKNYSIDFVKEEKFQGTAGGLKLLKDKLKDTFFLSNCDILIKDDLACAYKTHKMKNNKITFICSMKNLIIPYGVVETNKNGEIMNMKEKPDFSFLINTGVYIIEPDVLDYIGDDEFIHMPDLAQRCKEKGFNVGVFPVPEQAWMDMGQLAEMNDMMQKLGV
ncbi:MAG: NTP transferase domain-containing protein [Treponema sp.]|nr:NTP transferase domain-containing protein [Treponema sp.]